MSVEFESENILNKSRTDSPYAPQYSFIYRSVDKLGLSKYGIRTEYVLLVISILIFLTAIGVFLIYGLKIKTPFSPQTHQKNQKVKNIPATSVKKNI